MFHVAAFGRNQNLKAGKGLATALEWLFGTQTIQRQGQPMNKFLQCFGSKVIGHLNGFDRMLFRGSNRRLCNPTGILMFLYWIKVLLKDFGGYAKDTTSTLCNAIECQAASTAASGWRSK